MAVIGQANALGAYPEVPLIIRSLADAMFFDGVGHFVLSPEVIAIARTKTDVWDSVFSAPEYESAWWQSLGSDLAAIQKQELRDATRRHEEMVNMSCSLTIPLSNLSL